MFFTTPHQTTLAQRITETNANIQPHLQLSLGKYDSVIITLTRGDKRNALNFRMMEQLIWLAKQIRTWRDVRAVILQGDGESFCAGLDLSEIKQAKNRKKVAWELLKPSQSLYQKVCLIWQSLPVPVIAVIHGHCIGAGLQLALACDFRFATENCQFAIMESKWGLVPDMGFTQSTCHIAPDVLKELTMTARIFDSQTALALGFISAINENPWQHAEQLIAEIAQRSPDAVLASKRVIQTMQRPSAYRLYQEKLWQIKLLIGKNQAIAVKKAKDHSLQFLQRQWK
ncbi:MAG: crotonase/enoyl-CoA hydratase family protein [Acinetobacter sp.]|nr:crotonase/enoyl-CoA hydratase family protein [Acinetobacter sp.]